MPALTPAQRKLFEDKNLVNVATVGKDGTPRSTAIWVDLDGDDILLNGPHIRKWMQNLKRDPHVALNVFDLTNIYNQVNVLGEVVDITSEGGEEHIDKLSQKYNGRDYPDHQPANPRLIARVKITKVISW